MAVTDRLTRIRRTAQWTLFKGFEGLLVRLPGGRREFFDLKDFPWTGAIEADWRAIRAELDSVLDTVAAVPNFQNLAVEQAMLTTDDRWKTFWFFVAGESIAHNVARCPRTAELLAEIPGMTSAMFSILRGPKSLAPHRGPYKGFLRYHLALKVPDVAACWIRVGSETRHWTEGAALIFDDTFEHEAHNMTSEDRVVLFVDILRPLPFPLDRVNRSVVKALGRHSSSRAFLDRLAKTGAGLD